MRPRDTALALLVVVLWGVNFVVIKVGLRGVSPFVLGGLRCAFAAVPAVFFLRPPRVPVRLYAAFAFPTFLAQFALLFWAIRLGMPSGLTSVVQQSQAFFTVLLAAAVLREKPTAAQLLGISLAGVGLALIGSESGTSFPLAGFVLNVCSAAFWALGNLASRSLSRYGPVSGLAFVVWSSLLVPIPYFALAWAFEGKATIAASFHAMDAISWAAVAYLAFGATLGGYGLWNRLLKTYPAAQVAPFALLVPVIGLACGALTFRERLTAAQLAGSALVAAGLALPLAMARWRYRTS
ncbi:MAG TPA: EamA family transporter [Myxococcales bacterium]|nr:EamA family transporter [Myxococcales bacterium]